jgi:hypothetical protein
VISGYSVHIGGFLLVQLTETDHTTGMDILPNLGFTREATFGSHLFHVLRHRLSILFRIVPWALGLSNFSEAGLVWLLSGLAAAIDAARIDSRGVAGDAAVWRDRRRFRTERLIGGESCCSVDRATIGSRNRPRAA